MNKKVKFLIVFVMVLALTAFLVIQVDAAKPQWKHTFLEFLGGGGNAHKLSARGMPPIYYNCRPYVTVPGCNNDIPGKECFNGFIQETFDQGVACGMTVYYWSPDPPFQPEAICHYIVGGEFLCEFTINFEETFDPKWDFYGIPGWRTGFTYSGIADMRGYLGTYLFSSPFGAWLGMIKWKDGIRVPHRVDFSYDPETPTCTEYWGIPCGYVNPNQP